jgi:hypothetical protein
MNAVARMLRRQLFGTIVARPSRRVVRWLFLRGLGFVYLVAFTSLQSQLLGLYGSHGLQPIRDFLRALRAELGRDAYSTAPTLLWLGSSDRDLVRWCRAGQICALALLLGIAPLPAALALWALYLSFVAVGRDFLSFQWDALLLETGVHAALVAPPGLRPRLGQHEPSWGGASLMRWLVFRLHFQSGLIKLRSGDPTWRRCSACAYHYETQPLPTALGWYAHHLPPTFQRLSTATALAVELAAPFLVFAPRRPRKVAFATLTGLQAAIAATGNYGFFNLLTVVLGLWTLDDHAICRLPLCRRGRLRAVRRRQPAPSARAIAAVCSGAVGVVSAITFVDFLRESPLPHRLDKLQARLAPFRSSNSYGLFAVMTTMRPEIVIEGSDDGRDWRAYRFRYKPSEGHDPPRWIAPHQPRLDWQMWFAALGRPPRWFASLLVRLLEGSPDVLKLLGDDPFPDRPPRFVRALLYKLHATDIRTRRRTGLWWRRELVGTYFPACALA